MNSDKILRYLQKEDIPESCELLVEYLNIDADSLRDEAFFVGDGLDVFRFLLKNLEGITFRIPRIKSMQGLLLKFLTNRLFKDPSLSTQRLSHETGLDEKTIRQYIRVITKD